jgi:hypothetical protein
VHSQQSLQYWQSSVSKIQTGTANSGRYDKHMNSVLRILPLFAAIIFFSCTKEEVPPSTPGVTPSVQVEYRVYAASSSATVYAMLPVVGHSALSEEVIAMDRMTYSVTFEVKSGTEVSVSAKNSTPGPEEVTSEIYVNGQLVKSASANAPGQSASVTVIAQ